MVCILWFYVTNKIDRISFNYNIHNSFTKTKKLSFPKITKYLFNHKSIQRDINVFFLANTFYLNTEFAKKDMDDRLLSRFISTVYVTEEK